MSLYSKTPTITHVYDEAVPAKRRAVATVQKQLVSLECHVLDDTGNPLNLLDETKGASLWTASGSSSSSSMSSSASACTHLTATETADVGFYAQVRYREATLVLPTIYAVDGIITDAKTARVSAKIPQQITDKAGIYLAEVGILDKQHEALRHSNELFVFTRKSAWGTAPGNIGPPSLDDIRLSIRDNDPADNLLLDTYDFDLAEICHAAVRVVQLWNDQPPAISRAIYTTNTFPFRDIWLEGIQLFLFLIAEEHYRRNWLPHRAGGTSTDDKNKFREYRAAWQDRFQTFRHRIMHAKAQINAAGAYSTLGSGYPY